MKNKYYEYLRKKRKEFRKRELGNIVFNDKKIRVYHVYDELERPEYSWWDDVAFITPSNYYTIWWIHPRMKYRDLCDDIAHEQVSHLYPKNGLFGDDEKIHQKIGNSRKKIVGYRSKPSHKNVWFEELEKAKNKISREGDVIARPHFKIQPMEHAKGIDICYPMEIQNEQDLEKLVDIVKKILAREITFDELVNGYTYTKNEWNWEGHRHED